MISKFFSFYRRAVAFTLAETLIVMGIIGVVAALTLPNLNSSTNNKEKIAKVKKLYSNLNDAYIRAVAVYGPLDEWESNTNITKFYNRMTESMKLSKKSGLNAVTADGTWLNFDGFSNHIYVVTVDVDGENQGKNTVGKDRFYFEVRSKQGVIPFQNPEGDSMCDTFAKILSSANRMQCGSTWIVNYDTMDYLKLDSSGKCPNGTTPTESNPTCN